MTFLPGDSRGILAQSRTRRWRETEGGRTIPMAGIEAGILRGTRAIALAAEKPLIFGPKTLQARRRDIVLGIQDDGGVI